MKRSNCAQDEKPFSLWPKVSRAEGLKITYEYFKSLTPEELHEKDHNTFEGM